MQNLFAAIAYFYFSFFFYGKERVPFAAQKNALSEISA